MNRNHNLDKAFNPSHLDINRKVAFHEAGHAAAIYLSNKQKGLPPVYFQIFIKSLTDQFQESALVNTPDHKNIAQVIGGRLIHTLPSSIEAAINGFTATEKQAYIRAFEADMINSLVGPLAEAKYIAQRDGELINPILVNFNALHYYGGTSDLESVKEYLECFSSQTEVREQKITELFLAAFRFINDRLNWRAITTLAEYILAGDKNVIECEEIIAVLESGYQGASKRIISNPL
jgi:hypothetical protein